MTARAGASDGGEGRQEGLELRLGNGQQQPAGGLRVGQEKPVGRGDARGEHDPVQSAEIAQGSAGGDLCLRELGGRPAGSGRSPV